MYTKGEWKVSRGKSHFVVSGKDNTVIVKTPYYSEIDEANANLIAASPDMYEVLGVIKLAFSQELVLEKQQSRIDGLHHFLQIIGGALSKAEGEVS